MENEEMTNDTAVAPMTDIDVPDWVLSAARAAFGKSYYDEGNTENVAMRAALRAALSAWVVPQHQAYWPKEDCWEDITPEQFAELETTEAIIRIALTLRQEKPE